jgi:hypothetical protein
MSLHILLCDEVLLYFIVRVEVVEIQIWFEFCKTDLKKKKDFLFFPSLLGQNPAYPPAWPSQPLSSQPSSRPPWPSGPPGTHLRSEVNPTH